MFERYHESARVALWVARGEANLSGSEYIGAEHLLLGILREDKELLALLRLPAAEIRSRIQAAAGSGDDRNPPMSAAAKQVLVRAAEEADRLGHRLIAPIHLLIGLLQDEESLAAEILKSHGVTIAQVEALALPSPAVPAEAGMMQLIMGFWVSRALYEAATLGLADLVKDAPKPVGELAALTGSDPEALYRMLRALASIGVFEELDGQRFGTTPLGRTLEERPGSLRYFAMTQLGQEHYAAWEKFPFSVRTGKMAFTEKFKQPIWEYYAANPEHAEMFNRFMSNLTDWVTQAILAAYDFTPFHKIVDIGGGHGAFLAAMLSKAPGASGVLFDASAVLADSRQVERCEKIAGNFFEAVPEGGDLYTMKLILHDWTDEQCHAILTNIRKVIAPGGKVAIVETVLGPGPDAPFKNFLDLNMMVMTGGRERTAAEFKALLENAGFAFTRVTQTASPMGIVEGVAH